MPAPKDPKKRAEWIEGNRKAHLGNIPWNKNKTGVYSQETLDLMKRNLPDRSGKNHPYYGKHRSQAIKDKISKSLQGNIPWNVNTKGKGIMKPNSGSFKKGDVSYWKGKHLSKEHIKKVLTRRTPSSLEEKFQGIIDECNLSYKFVGDGSFFIEQFNPDFINTNNEKIAIEVYASFFKKQNYKSIDEWKEDRRKIFRKYGWKIIYFDETQVNEKYVLSHLEGGK